jgi:Uma2 family endonuclease
MSQPPRKMIDQFWIRYGYKPYELINGRVQPLKKLVFAHSIVALRMTTLLEQFVNDNDLGEVVGANAGFALSDNTLRSPRAAYISRAKWDSIRYPYSYYPFAPDIVVEVGQTDEDEALVRASVKQYLQAGAARVWYLYPDLQQVISHLPDGKYEAYHMDGTLKGEDVIPGLELPLTMVFPRQKKEKGS